MGILKRFPHDLTVLRELHVILVEMSDLKTCANLFQQAFDHYQQMHPTGRMASSPLVEATGGELTLMEILVLADLYNALSEYEQSVQVIKQGCRWLQGRGAQRHWDACADDREFDSDVCSRRNPDDMLQPGMYVLDINARQRLAISRIKLGDIEEGKVRPFISP